MRRYIGLLDDNLRVAWLNGVPAGLPASSLLGRYPWEIALPSSSSAVERAVLLCIANQNAQTVEVQAPREAGGPLRAIVTFAWCGKPGVKVVTYATVLPEQIELLTHREREIAILLGQGLTTKKIASLLGVARSTIDSHRANIADKIAPLPVGTFCAEVGAAFHSL